MSKAIETLTDTEKVTFLGAIWAQPVNAVLTATTASFTTADETKLDALAAPLALDAVPVDGTPNFLETSFTGTNNDLRFVQVDDATPAPSISFFRSVLPPLINVFERAISIQFQSSSTASQIKTLLEASSAAMALVTVSFKAGNDGTGTNAGGIEQVLAATLLSGGTTGTTGIMGQTAIVSHSDDTKTEWGCVKSSLSEWLPRTAGIIHKPDTGLWYRQTLVSDGTAEYELLPNQ